MAITPFSTSAIPSAGQLMHTNLVTVSPDASLFEAANLMATHRFSGLPVVDGYGKAVGVVTLADLAACWLHQDRQGKQEMSFYRNLCGQSEDMAGYFAGFYQGEATLSVADVMTPQVLHVSEHTLVTDVIKLLTKHHVHRVFVSRNQQLVGVVTTSDIMLALPEMLG